MSPLLPGSFQNTLAAAQAPMMALLNLSVVFCGLAGLGILAGMLTRQWLTMILLCSGSIVLSRLTYRAAVSQAAEVASMLRVAFDLYRYDILGQLGKPSPEDMAAERALWLSLTREVLGAGHPAAGAEDGVARSRRGVEWPNGVWLARAASTGGDVTSDETPSRARLRTRCHSGAR
ncbi:MAG: hypothetical protein R2853_11555 [Thermomicrobiales bacterium]